MTDIALEAPSLPTRPNILFWKRHEQAIGYRNIEKVFNVQRIPRGETVLPLPAGAPFDVTWTHEGQSFDLGSYMEANDTDGLLILKDGQIRAERYRNGFTPDQRWTSFSIAKSVTSSLVGAAIADGFIKGFDDLVTNYIPELAGSAYDGVTVRHLLTMSSGVRWSEDYADPNSDVARPVAVPTDGTHPVVANMAALKRAAEPGTRFNYNTGETDLTGVLVARATGKSLSAYLSEKIWAPFGMDSEAIWICDKEGRERGGSCISMTLRDYARYGLFMLGGGVAGGKQVLPAGWTTDATTNQFDTPLNWPGVMGGGYGYQWWTLPDGDYRGSGIFGQGLYINPAKQLIIVTLSAWPTATSEPRAAARMAFWRAVRDAI